MAFWWKAKSPDTLTGLTIWPLPKCWKSRTVCICELAKVACVSCTKSTHPSHLHPATIRSFGKSNTRQRQSAMSKIELSPRTKETIAEIVAAIRKATPNRELVKQGFAEHLSALKLPQREIIFHPNLVNACKTVWTYCKAAIDKEWGAARGAARDAAWGAAWDAARDAARDAAWDAAWDAARDAAWVAARDAAAG